MIFYGPESRSDLRVDSPTTGDCHPESWDGAARTVAEHIAEERARGSNNG